MAKIQNAKVDIIHSDGAVEISGIVDGINWRTVLFPGDWEAAANLLSSTVALKDVWTDAVVRLYETHKSQARDTLLMQQQQMEILEARQHRNTLLNDCDIIYCNAANWSLMLAKEQWAWQEYKQLLRDVPQQKGFPNNIIWPQLPLINKADTSQFRPADSKLTGGQS